MKLEVVSHCYNYAGYLAHQLASFARNAPRRHELIITICFNRHDQDTVAVIAKEQSRRGNVCRLGMEVCETCNRAIGRNSVAKATDADWLWFADCDYVVGRHWLDRVCDELLKYDPRISIAYPRTVSKCSPSRGRELAAQALAGDPAFLTFAAGAYFEPQRCCKATGGTMFVRGSVCRELGYLDGKPEAHKPAEDGQWQPCWQDPYFKQSVLKGGREATFKVRGLYRLGN